jgi:glycosyltransferase involved in cell wall biosynthesis
MGDRDMGQDRIIITDAWTPQVNGVVRTYENVQTQLVRMGVSFSIIHPYWKEFSRMPCPEYPEIELVTNPWKLVPILKRLQGSRFHIATEGPLGLVARLYLASKGISYTTSYHTKYPEFLKELIGIPATWTYPFFRWFHRDSSHVLVPTARLREELEVKGFQRVCVWSSGIDRDLFNPIHRDLQAYVGPYVVCVSRVSKEKGLDDFCQLPKELTKVLVGDGPYLS